jgi:amino acid transporter
MSLPGAIKRIFVGRPMSSGELEHTLLPKTIALPVFASDPLSSNAYATQEILLTLGLAGTAALHFVLPISFAVAALLAIVVTSYRQTVRAYPSGGGAYRVSSENLGKHAGLLAASALLLDYVLTVSVSITAGTDAIISAAPGLADKQVLMAMLFVAFVTLMNLRGVKESGSLFAIPTYGFVLCIYALLITGFIKCIGGCPQAASATKELHHVTGTVGLFLILRAFAAGTTALTGVEAIADGVQAFRYPQSKNAATTLAIMGVLAASMFLGISWLADNTNVVYEHGDKQTVVAQISQAIFGGGFMFYLLQVLTAGILILAANTAYADFPRLSSILAHDKFMPRQFKSRGDRLVFSNGVVILAVMSTSLIIVFNANLNDLIQLYLVGVFISFTLSQSGMFLRWRRLKGKNWQRSAVINGFGAFVTGTVFWVIVSQKFLEGAWIVIAAIPVLMYFMNAVHKHYTDVEGQLLLEARRPTDRRPGNQHVVILLQDLDAACARTVGYVRSLRPASVAAIAFDASKSAAWKRFAPEIPIVFIDPKGSRTEGVRNYLRARRAELTSDDFLTLAMPEMMRSRSTFELVRSIRLQRMKAKLLFERDVQLMDLPMTRDEIDPNIDESIEPARNYVLVLVARPDNATLHAIEYAETLRGTNLRCINFGLDPEETEALGDMWLRDRIPHVLELEAAPFRDIGASISHFVRDFRPDGVDRVVTVVLPEFIVGSPRHQLLHNQTALVVKRHLLFERGVVTVSVPYHLERERARTRAGREGGGPKGPPS